MTSDRQPFQDYVDLWRELPVWLRALIVTTIVLALAAAIFVACDMVHWYRTLPHSPD